MAQNPLPPPPPSGGVLDGWLYMLWRRLTQAGQILWESITPGTSADVAAAVTDETGSPGSLVFSGNPTIEGITNAGNLVFSGDGRRIQANFSSTGSGNTNRTIFQTSTTNGNSFILAMPNGTSQIAGIGGYDSSTDVANCSTVVMYTTGGGSVFASDKTGTGTYRKMSFYTSGIEQVYINTDGVLFPKQATTAGAPAYVKGGMYFDTTLSKLRIGGASGWETVTSS